MIIEKQKLSLTDFIEQKRIDFNEVRFMNISEAEKINFLKNKGLLIDKIKKQEQKNLNKSLLVLISGFLFSFTVCYPSFLFFVILSSISLGLALKIKDMSIPDSLIDKMKNEWLNDKKNEDILKAKIFEATVVDENTLIFFSKTYGEQELVKLLMNKEHLTYNDIIIYIEKEKEREAIKGKEIRLTKAIRCMNLKETAHPYNN